jgi:hypothetical protein
MLCARIALPAARMGAFELLVEALPAAPSLSRRAGAVWLIVGVCVVLIGVVAVASAASGVVVGAIRGSGGVLGAGRGVHFLGIGLEFAKIRALACMHWQDLSSHRGHERGVESWERREARLCRMVSPRASLDPRARLDRAGLGGLARSGWAGGGRGGGGRARRLVARARQKAQATSTVGWATSWAAMGGHGTRGVGGLRSGLWGETPSSLGSWAGAWGGGRRWCGQPSLVVGVGADVGTGAAEEGSTRLAESTVDQEGVGKKQRGRMGVCRWITSYSGAM